MYKKGIYLGAYKALHKNYNIVYQDINGKRDLAGDMLDIDLSNYDFIIATPPCNYYSKARGNNKPSLYAEQTKHLLPDIINKLRQQNKPFIVENVRNFKKFNDIGLMNLNDTFIYFIGRHTYRTNIMFNTWVPQTYDFIFNGYRLKSNTQGGDNVFNVIESWLKEVHNGQY